MGTTTAMHATITLGSEQLHLTLGEIIRKVREDADLTQQQLADKLKVSRVAVAGWENNRHLPNHATLVMLADTVNRDVSVFPDKQGMPTSRCTGDRAGGTLLPIYRARRNRNRTPSTKPFLPRLVR